MKQKSRLRFIGIRHRIKKTKDNESRPTQMAILQGEEVKLYELPSETDELDFAMGRFVTKMRKPEDDEDLSKFASHQIKWRALKKDEKPEDFPENLVRPSGKKSYELAVKVPGGYDGLEPGDTVAMMLGGSGDYLAFSLSRQLEKMSGRVLRIPPFVFKAIRGDEDKDFDAEMLARTARENPDLFYQADQRDRDLIMVREAQRARIDAMKERIACEQRLRSRIIGLTFCRPDGLFPEGAVEKMYDQAKANDIILQAMLSEEEKRLKELEKALNRLDINNDLFAPITGAGPAISGRLISAIIDIRRFWKEPDPQRMFELYQQTKDLESRGDFMVDQPKVPGITPDMSAFERLGKVAAWQRKNGKAEQAELLQQSIALHRERSQLRQLARMKSQAALRKFCGVHVMPDGTFPRRRSGQVANWNPECRQALYLLGDQFNRRPNTVWGQRLLEHKRLLREVKHPHVECKTCGNGKKWEDCGVKGHKRQYNDGHIHKIAIWKTLSDFVTWLFDEWTRLEVEYRKRPTPLSTDEDQQILATGTE